MFGLGDRTSQPANNLESPATSDASHRHSAQDSARLTLWPESLLSTKTCQSTLMHSAKSKAASSIATIRAAPQPTRKRRPLNNNRQLEPTALSLATKPLLHLPYSDWALGSCGPAITPLIRVAITVLRQRQNDKENKEAQLTALAIVSRCNC